MAIFNSPYLGAEYPLQGKKCTILSSREVLVLAGEGTFTLLTIQMHDTGEILDCWDAEVTEDEDNA
jgi:hypothetical protein